jgi:hypothetical protein
MFLLKNGANLTLCTSTGMNIYHLAAQGDKVRTFLALQNINQFGINCKDFKNSTPLHWASYISSEKVV